MKSLKKIFFACTRTERVVLVLAALAFAVSATVAISLSIAKRTVVVPAKGGEWREGVIGQPVYVNPVLATSETDKYLVRLLFANLGELAQKIEVDESGRSWKIRLKERLVWSDGQKITSDDVIFTVEKLRDPKSQSPHPLVWQGITVNRLSELELQFNLVSPYPFFMEYVKRCYVVPKHLFAETPLANWRLSEYNLKPIGSGPYELDTYEKQQSGFITAYRLKANPRYAGKQPFIRTISFRFFPNAANLLEAFNTGMIDGFAEFDPQLIAKVNRPHQAISFSLPSYYAAFFNQGQSLALKDREVRRALGAAVDRSDLIRMVLSGNAKTVNGPVPFSVAEETAPRDANPLSLEEALRELERVGWKMNGEGFREKTVKKTVVPLAFDLTVPQVPFLVATAEYLKTAWEKIGAKVSIVKLPAEEIAERAIVNREYQALLFGNVLTPALDLYAFWHSNERFYPGLNLALYSNKRADELIEAIRRNFDPESRSRELAELESIIVNDFPAVFLYSPDYLFVATKELRGVAGGTLGEPADRFQKVSDWYLRTSRVLN